MPPAQTGVDHSRRAFSSAETQWPLEAQQLHRHVDEGPGLDEPGDRAPDRPKLHDAGCFESFAEDGEDC